MAPTLGYLSRFIYRPQLRTNRTTGFHKESTFFETKSAIAIALSADHQEKENTLRHLLFHSDVLLSFAFRRGGKKINLIN